MPETGQDFGPCPSLHDLQEQLRASYKANGYEIPDNITELIEAYICNRIPEYCTGNESAMSGPVTLEKMLSVSYHNVLVQTKRLLGIDERVPQSQAEARAYICTHSGPNGTACPENVSRQDCTGCHQASLRNLVNRISGSRGTPYDSQLNVCRVCLCELKSKVHLPLVRLLKIAGEAEFTRLPEHCWMVKESQAL